MKTWSRVTNEAGRSNKGRIPSWFMQNGKKLKNYWEELENTFKVDDLELLLQIDNRLSVIKRIFKFRNFIKGLEYKDNEILHIYTDAGKKDNNCGVGWVILDEKGVEIYTDNMGFMRSGISCFIQISYQRDKTKISLNQKLKLVTYWRGLLINQNPREFMKEVNQIKYKAEWSVLDINRCSYIRDGYRLGIVDGNYYLRYHGRIIG
ncbi:21980_t:CDS:2 [Rhizophagus irregularis]|nr:21980_t:CDS:2 [Rhizophagus irregularis]